MVAATATAYWPREGTHPKVLSWLDMQFIMIQFTRLCFGPGSTLVVTAGLVMHELREKEPNCHNRGHRQPPRRARSPYRGRLALLGVTLIPGPFRGPSMPRVPWQGLVRATFRVKADIRVQY